MPLELRGDGPSGWSAARERLRFLPLLEVLPDDWSVEEERLLADALRLLHSSVTPSGVKRQVQDLLQQVMHHLTASPLQAARCARRTLERNSSSLAALWALEVVSLCSVNLWLLDREEREDLILQVRRMRSEGLWPEKAEEILRSFQEQEQLFEHRVSLPRCRSASSPFRPELAVLVPRPTTVATREPRAVVAPRTATRRDGLKERTFLLSEKPRKHPRCFDSMQVMRRFQLPHRFEGL